MNEFSVLMSLVDYIPVVLFTAATVILIRDLYNKMSKGAFALFAAGTIDVIAAGFLKATYKLLYALAVCDFTKLSTVFFPMQSLGFMLAGLGILALLVHRQTENPEKVKRNHVRLYGAVTVIVLIIAVMLLLLERNVDKTKIPEYFSGTFVFVTLMVLGLGFMDAGLSVMSCRVGKKGLVALFVLSFFFSLCMGYLSSKNFEKASMNWIAEGVNTLGQGLLLTASVLLHRSGLEKLRLHGEENV